MLHTLSSRLLVTHLIVAVVAIALVGLLSSQLFRHYYVSRVQQELGQAGDELARHLGRLLDAPDAPDKVALVAWAASRSLGGRVCVFDTRKSRLLASSDMKAGASGASVADWGECEAEASARIESTQVTCHPGPVISVLAPITDPKSGTHLGMVLLRRPLGEVEATSRLSSLLAGVSGAAAAALALLLAVLVSRAIARPLAEVARTASDLAEGDFSARARRAGPLEVRTVAASLNRMADALAKAFAELSGERARLADILASMEEGVVSLDAQGRVLVANAAAARLLGHGAETLVGRRLAAVLPDAKVAADLEALLAGRSSTCDCTVRVADRSLRLHGSQVQADQAGAVLVIADVTEAERLERLRREFVANASHELRAPLTSIQGFLAALADGTAVTEQERQRALQLAGEQAELMRRLVDQLLDLSRLQAGVAPLDRTPLDLSALAEAALAALTPQARAKRVSLRLEAQPTLPVLADGDRIMQVLMNLLDNAIRFSPEGGEVLVAIAPEPPDSAPKESQQVRTTVRDHGPGIPESELPYIWERFHKADRSRQRAGGGAGLGLAIAREIVVAHGGAVEAMNAEDGGAVLAFTLPTADATVPPSG